MISRARRHAAIKPPIVRGAAWLANQGVEAVLAEINSSILVFTSLSCLVFASHAAMSGLSILPPEPE
jgi:hypothetical protein